MFVLVCKHTHVCTGMQVNGCTSTHLACCSLPKGMKLRASLLQRGRSARMGWALSASTSYHSLLIRQHHPAPCIASTHTGTPVCHALARAQGTLWFSCCKPSTLHWWPICYKDNAGNTERQWCAVVVEHHIPAIPSAPSVHQHRRGSHHAGAVHFSARGRAACHLGLGPGLLLGIEDPDV